jgi:chaperonin GroES
MQMPAEEISQEEQIVNQLNAFIGMNNIAENLDDDVLEKIGTKVVEDYNIDKESRKDWEVANEKTLELARQLAKEKTWAGEAVANVKYPILATSAIQFSARAYPNLVKGKEVVKVQTIGEDESGEKANKAERVRQLLMCLPLIGCFFKKTYFKPDQGHPQSDIVFPDNLVVHYYAKSLEPRATEIIELYPNDIVERQRMGLFLDVELGHPQESGEEDQEETDERDEDRPHVFLEQHRLWDLDDDGYQEPYVITVHRDTEQVVRITTRYDVEEVKFNDAGQIIKIEPVQHYTQYTFMPSFDGSFYRMGFGSLLSDLNKSINTVINQLLDSGTLNNRQSGFLGKGIRLTRGGATSSLKFQPGEWKMVGNSGDDLRKGIVPLPAKPPSPVLFKLLGLLMEAADQVASQADVLTGEQPKGNVPATTTLALIEQGLKVFSAVYKRIHRSLKEEFKKIRRLNKLYLKDDQYQRVLDEPEGASVTDYADDNLDIVPLSDSADVADVQRLVKAEALMSLLGQGLNDMEIRKRYLQALQTEDMDELLPEEGEEPPPPPEVLIEEAKLAQKDAELQMEEYKLKQKDAELQIKAAETHAKIIKLRADAMKAMADAEAAEAGPQLEYYKNEIKQLEVELNFYNGLIQANNPQGISITD